LTDGPVATDSFGFREFECPSCRNITTLDLPQSYRFIYWFLLVGCLGLGAYVITQGMMFPLPAVFAIVPGYALYRDRNIRRINARIAMSRPK